MLFWTVVMFVAYSVIYFISSQLKMKKLRNNISSLNRSLNEKTHLLQQTRSYKGHYETVE